MKHVTIVTGHYGSGKSEFSINLAIHRAAEGRKIAVADVDVVNPYFRSREQRSLLVEHGVRVVANQLEIDRGVDLPAISPEVFGLLRDGETVSILDAGGDPVGARLLGSLRRLLDPFETEVLCVVNASRPETSDHDRAIAMIRSIEAAAGLTVTGLVNNTHMLEFTELDHIRQGQDLCRAITDTTGIPVRYVGVPLGLEKQLTGGDRRDSNGRDANEVDGEIIPIAMYLRESWMFA